MQTKYANVVGIVMSNKKHNDISNFKKGFLIIAGSLAMMVIATIIGANVIGIFSGLGDTKVIGYEPETAVTSLRLDLKNNAVKLYPADDGQLTVTYNERKNENIKFSYTGGELTVTRQSGAKFFWFGGDKDTITVYIPADFKSVDVKTTNAAADLGALTLGGSLTLSTTNGRIECNAPAITGDLKLSTTNSMVKCSGAVVTGNLEIRSTNGQIDSSNGTVKGDAVFKTSNSRLNILGMTVSKTDAQTTNGAIRVTALSSPNGITLKTTNGSVTGDIMGDITDFTIKARTTNAENNLENKDTGTTPLAVTTTNGDIYINFNDEK